VEHGQGDISRLGQLRGLEQGSGEARRPAKELAYFLFGELEEERLKELANDSEGEGPFELGPAGRKHLHLGLLRQSPCLHEERALADTGRSLDPQQKPATTNAVDQRLDGGELGASLEEFRPRQSRRIELVASRLLTSVQRLTFWKV
jgi:hypothetical protein